MRCGVIARKLGMSRVFSDDGQHVPVTVLRIEDVEVLSVKSIEKDGYTAVQLGFSNKKPKNITKPVRGFFAKAKAEPKEKVVEFRVSEDAILNVGDKLGVNHFVTGQKVDVVGISNFVTFLLIIILLKSFNSKIKSSFFLYETLSIILNFFESIFFSSFL